VSPNILEDHFSKFGLVANCNVNRGANNTTKKSFGVIVFQETQACKRVLQNPRHFVNDQLVEVALSRFCLEMLMSPSTVWAWELSWSLEQEELAVYFAQFGAVYRAIHIGNPATGEKKGYGLVDFVEEDTAAKACRGPGKGPYSFTLKGSRAFYGRFLPRELKRDLMYMEDRFGNELLKQLHQKVPDSGSWGVAPQGVKAAQLKTATCKLPRAMLPVVVGEDGKIVSDIAKAAKAKVTLVRSGAHQETAIFHLVGTPDAVKTAQYMMQIKIKEKMAKTQGGLRYNR
jgi:RNA recognition motif-containing protein